MKKILRVLYAGDSPVGGAANYLLGVLGRGGFQVRHLPPDQKLEPAHLKQSPQVVIFSDYSRSRVSAPVEKQLEALVLSGKTGFLMIGGWGSYSGPFGGWKGSLIEKLLPVRCLAGDDRTNFPGGAAVIPEIQHRILDPRAFRQAPAVCGMNAVTLRPGSRLLLSVRRILTSGNSVSLEKKKYPLLALKDDLGYRTASLTTDLAPHWCGGLVDWGIRTLTLPVNNAICVQIGNYYVEFVTRLIRWTAGAL